ncbi:MAG: hypothetical protein GYB36_03610 [Alphaproteobacteria bacterium]|nr:hypothetical protein [Alphaproteobacteria bacterium]
MKPGRLLIDTLFIAAGVFIGLQVFQNPIAAVLMALAVVIADFAVHGSKRRKKAEASAEARLIEA